jgi:FAD:protein FMN transferase
MRGERTDREVADGWTAGVSGSVVHADRVVHVEHVWGTVISINLSGTAGRTRDALAGIEQCCGSFAAVDATFSTYRPLSEVTLFRAGLDRPGRHSEQFEEVMRACLDLRTATRGAFDPWAVPGGYDPSAYVKGWATGRASAILAAAGFRDHLVNAGGDICARGDEVPGSRRGWPVGIVNPHEPTQIIEVVDLRDQAMATSGRYERGDHVVDPVTRLPAVGVDSATVIGPDPGIADALSSAALVDGTRSVGWFSAIGPEWSLHVAIGNTVHTWGPGFDGGDGRSVEP